jgi:hypothetical protein
VNSLEERARAAVRATAAEIGPDDVPPLRLPESGAGHPAARSRRPGWRQGARRWGAPLAAAAAVLAVVATAGLLASVLAAQAPYRDATPTRLSLGSLKPGPAGGAAPAYPPDLVAGLTGFLLPASGAQYSAGALLDGQYKALEQEAVARCMAKSGFRVPVLSPAENAAPDWDLTQYPDLGAIARAGKLPSYSVGPAPAESKAYKAALAGCGNDLAELWQNLRDVGNSLASSFLTIVSQIQASAPVTATLPALRACAARYGWPSQPYGAPDSTINSFADFADWVAGHLDGAGSRGASAAQLNALDRHWGTVFVQCARPTVTVMERLQLAAQAKFLREHQRQFAAVVKLARADFAAAERLARG